MSFGSTLVLLMMFVLLFCLCAWGIVSLAAQQAKARLTLGRDVKLVVYRLSRFVRYFHVLLFLPYVLGSVGLVYYLVRSIHPVSVQLTLRVVFEAMLYALLKGMYSLPVYSVMKKVRSMGQTRRKYVLRSMIQPFIMALVYGTWVGSSLLFSPHWQEEHALLNTLYFMGTFALIFFVGSAFTRFVLRTTSFSANQVPQRWQEMVQKSGLRNVHFYLWKTKKNRIANAMAMGLMQPRIFVSDYLLEQMTEAEGDAVIAHELGHLQKRHLWQMFVLAELWFPIVAVLQFASRIFHVSEGYSVWVTLGLLVFYQGLFFHWMSRRFEYQADAHSSALMGGETHMVSGLQKLSDLSLSLQRIPKFDELWMTHPSIYHRISRLERAMHGGAKATQK
jgi:Zn-dependent protease with chaperone function